MEEEVRALGVAVVGLGAELDLVEGGSNNNNSNLMGQAMVLLRETKELLGRRADAVGSEVVVGEDAVNGGATERGAGGEAVSSFV